jgi:peptidyl-prolyl cis-trans isomerase B (cyclophilin B)
MHNILKTLMLCLTLAVVAGTGTVMAKEGKSMVSLRTSMGEIVIELDETKAPETAANFLQYVRDGFYDGTIFHRVIERFMIQGGGMDKDMVEKPTRRPIKNEADNGLKNERYAVAMARTQDPNSATAQFFINVKDNPGLNHREKTIQGWGYAVFGKVVKGHDVVDKIKAVPTTTKGYHQDVPSQPVIIEKATVIEGKD